MAKINEKTAQEIKDELVRQIMGNGTPYIIKDGDHYDVNAVNVHFRCTYTDEQIAQMADLCLELLEELRRINEEGYTRKDLEQAERDAAGSRWELTETMSIYGSFASEKLEEITKQLGTVTLGRLDGASYVLLARPAFIRCIYVVFDVIIDKFEDVWLYDGSLLLLIRGAMQMNSIWD